MAGLKLKKDEYYDQAKMVADRQALQDKYGSAGGLSAAVKVTLDSLEESHQLDLVYKVTEGETPPPAADGLGSGARQGDSKRRDLTSSSGTRESERAVAAAINWFARHQSPDGSWSLDHYTDRCKDETCAAGRAAGAASDDIAATALGLLPFLAAAQTHQSKGPYRQLIQKAVDYLIAKQQADGSFEGAVTMYSHGLASIALCGCFGMTGDKAVGKAAQAALDYIVQAQDPKGGGWRYVPKIAGDTSVTGWQIAALRSGQLAGLKVPPAVFEQARKFLKSVSSSAQGNAEGGLFGYQKGNVAPTPPLTAVGLLCYQHLGVPRTDPAMIEGTAYLMKNPPDAGERNVYYWYYATQVMHNQPGPDWDDWNRKIRKILIDSQVKDGCAAGSWDPKTPQADVWGEHRGGRVMQTSLSALTLEVYYRYLAIYRLDKDAAAAEKPAHDALELNIDNTGSLKVDGAAVPDIERYIAGQAERSRMTAGMTAAQIAVGEGLPTTVVIRADRATPFKAINRVIKACQDNGFRQFAMTAGDKRLTPQSPVDAKDRQTPGFDGVHTLTIHVFADPKTGTINRLRVGEMSVPSIATLAEKLKELFADPGNPFDQVVIQVSGACRYDELMNIVEICTHQALPGGKKLLKLSFVEVPSD